MLRRPTGNCYSQSARAAAAAVISGTPFNFRACPTKRYRRAAFLRNIFRNLTALVAIPPPRKNPDAAACVGKPGKRCHQFAFGLPQRCRKPLEVASMIYLNLIEIRSKNPVSCLDFAAAFGRSA
jgi:hypothetical protein